MSTGTVEAVEVQLEHPLAVVEAVEDSLVSEADGKTTWTASSALWKVGSGGP
jgi:hypothetical protein